MLNDYYFIVSVFAGLLILAIVLYRFVKGIEESKGIACLLCLMSFIFISSPLWSKIVIKNEDVEISLYRDLSTNQTKANIYLIENFKNYITDEKKLKNLDKILKEMNAQIAQINEKINENAIKTLAKSTSKAVSITRPKPPVNLSVE
jgi:Na+/melibiose symporter-like transporter